jgi:hypothetical protein
MKKIFFVLGLSFFLLACTKENDESVRLNENEIESKHLLSVEDAKDLLLDFIGSDITTRSGETPETKVADCKVTNYFISSAKGWSAIFENENVPVYEFTTETNIVKGLNYFSFVYSPMQAFSLPAIASSLSASRPVFMGGGYSSVSGHAWVCDGYRKHDYGYGDVYEYLNLNWGEGYGTSNGFFYVDNTPSFNGCWFDLQIITDIR